MADTIFKRSRHSPQSVQNQSMLQPVEITNSPIITQPDQTFQRSSKDLSSKGKCSISLKNIEIWEKSSQTHSDKLACGSILFYCILMYAAADNVRASSLRLLEAVAKSIKHATAISTILATEIFQARHDAVLATSKLLLDNSNHELRNAPINYKTLFGNKIKEVDKGNFEAQQQRFLATSSVATTMQQQQKVTYPAPPVFKRSKQPTKPSRPQQTQPYRPKSQTQSYSSNRKEYARRSGNQKQFPSSKQASSSTKFWSNPFHCQSYNVQTLQWEEGWPILWNNGKK